MILDIPEKSFFPVMGTPLTSHNSLKMDFTSANASLSEVDLKNTAIFNDYIFDLLKQADKNFGYGGYLENRVIYRRSEHFQQGESRCFHLGIDIWAQAGQPIYCPFDAQIHSYANNDNFGDYGPTIILEHSWKRTSFFTLYGHLSTSSLKNLEEGKTIQKGEIFCEIGPYPENGDWPPHLHFQVINNMQGRKGDFPGVCSASELSHFKEICLDPHTFIR